MKWSEEKIYLFCNEKKKIFLELTEHLWKWLTFQKIVDYQKYTKIKDTEASIAFIKPRRTVKSISQHIKVYVEVQKHNRTPYDETGNTSTANWHFFPQNNCFWFKCK